MRQISAILILVLGVNVSAYAGGPWPKPKGKGYFKLGEWWTVFDQHYTDLGLIDPNTTNGVFNTLFYAEYGLTDHWTVQTNAALFSRNFMNTVASGTTREVIIPGEAINTIGDIDVGIKYGWNAGRIPVALSLTLGLPTGESAGGSLGNLQTGDGEFNQIIQLDVGSGWKLGSHDLFSTAYIGFNNRTQGFSEELRFGFETGTFLLNKKLLLIGRLNIVESLKNGETAETITSSSVFANNAEFTSVGIEASWYLTENLGFSAGVAGALRGEIIAAAPAYSIGVFYDLK